ncbi:MAG: hypothetical protein KC416_07120 [Myxococcales bacterium]|nr:hypothetical protein [Myxococcales bacterium]
MRRAVHLDCDVVSDYWDEPVPLRARNLSPRGLWLDSRLALEVGDRVSLAFRPPRWRSARPLAVEGVVRRVSLRPDPAGNVDAGMGIEFSGIYPWERDALRETLEGLPPPLPHTVRQPSQELIWVDSLLTWEEDLGDRVNTFEVSERLAIAEGDELVFQALAPVLTTPRRELPFWYEQLAA